MANVKLGTKAVGSIVKIKVNGASKDFIVVQQGNPNTGTYDSSCAGTWLLMKDIYTTSTFGNNNSYKDSSIHSYLNGTFFNLIDGDIRNAIKQVKIPYQNGTGSGGSLATGSNGLSTKVFLLSGYEVGWTTSDNGYFPKDGVRLAYFGNSSGGNSKRIAYNGSSAAIWWLRSPGTYNSSDGWLVNTDVPYINREHENQVLANLVGLTKRYILLSWPAVGAGTLGYVSLRPAEYVVRRLEEFGYKKSDGWTDYFCSSASLPDYKTSLFLFEKTGTDLK